MDKFRYALKRAHEADPGNDFVAGCSGYYKRHGFLTEKQIAALDRVTPSHTSRYRLNQETGEMSSVTSLSSRLLIDLVAP